MLTETNINRILQEISDMSDKQGFDLVCLDTSERQILLYQEFENLVRYTYILSNQDEGEAYDVHFKEYSGTLFSSLGGESGARTEKTAGKLQLNLDGLFNFLSEVLHQSKGAIIEPASTKMVMMRRIGNYMVTRDLVHPDDWEEME